MTKKLHYTPFQQTLANRDWLFEPGVHSTVISTGPNHSRNGSVEQIEMVLMDKGCEYKILSVTTNTDYKRLGHKTQTVRWEVF